MQEQLKSYESANSKAGILISISALLIPISISFISGTDTVLCIKVLTIIPTALMILALINRLKNAGYTFMNDFDPHWLEETTGSILDNYATCNMVHTNIIKIAELAKTSALHINSALYQYGRKDI